MITSTQAFSFLRPSAVLATCWLVARAAWGGRGSTSQPWVRGLHVRTFQRFSFVTIIHYPPPRIYRKQQYYTILVTPYTLIYYGNYVEKYIHQLTIEHIPQSRPVKSVPFPPTKTLCSIGCIVCYATRSIPQWFRFVTIHPNQHLLVIH